MTTPNKAVNIKETIQNRINPKKLNNEEKQCSIDFKGMLKRCNFLIILQIIF